MRKFSKYSAPLAESMYRLPYGTSGLLLFCIFVLKTMSSDFLAALKGAPPKEPALKPTETTTIDEDFTSTFNGALSDDEEPKPTNIVDTSDDFRTKSVEWKTLAATATRFGNVATLNFTRVEKTWIAVIDPAICEKFISKPLKRLAKSFGNSDIQLPVIATPTFKTKKDTEKWKIALAALGSRLSKDNFGTDNNVYTHYIKFIKLASTEAYQISAICSLEKIHKKWCDIVDPQIRSFIDRFIAVVNNDRKWKLNAIATEFANTGCFTPARLNVCKWTDPESGGLYAHQQEFMEKFASCNKLQLHWSTSSGKSAMIPVLSKEWPEFLVFHITQPLLVMQGVAVALAAGRPVGYVEDDGTINHSPMCNVVRDRRGNVVSSAISILVSSYDNFVKHVQHPELAGKKIIYVFDDLSVAEWRQVDVARYEYIILMSATYVFEGVPTLYNNAVYGFVNMFWRDQLVTPMHSCKSVDEIGKLLDDPKSAWKLRCWSPAVLCWLHSHGVDVISDLKLEMMSYEKFAKYTFEKSTQLAICPEWPQGSQYTLDEMHANVHVDGSKGMLIATDHSEEEMSRVWQQALWSTPDYRSQLASEITRERAWRRKTVPISKDDQKTIQFKHVRIPAFKRAFVYNIETKSDGKLAYVLDTIDNDQMRSCDRLSGLSHLSRNAVEAASHTTDEITLARCPYVALYSSDCNGHNLDSTSILLTNLNELDALIQSFGRVGRASHALPGCVYLESKTVFDRMFA